MIENKVTNIVLSDEDYQKQILQGVSRTFALTIPQLPPTLVKVVGNAYLLCRIADTIEDEPALTVKQKENFSRQFVAVVQGDASAQEFSDLLYPLLSDSMLQAERELVQQSPRVIRVLRGFTPNQQASLQRCVTIMSEGMSRFQLNKQQNGVKNLEELNEYCYYVAGVVGEMLTELLCDYSKDMNDHRGEMMALAVSFGQGLQMTNILKDIREDYKRGACWLPRDHFIKHRYDIEKLDSDDDRPQFRKGLDELLSIAQSHLQNALSYTLLIPRKEAGVRKFCLLAIAMALLTLRKIRNNPDYKSGKEVKITRSSVVWVVLLTRIFSRSNFALKTWFYIVTFRSTFRY